MNVLYSMTARTSALRVIYTEKTTKVLIKNHILPFQYQIFLFTHVMRTCRPIFLGIICFNHETVRGFAWCKFVTKKECSL